MLPAPRYKKDDTLSLKVGFIALAIMVAFTLGYAIGSGFQFDDFRNFQSMLDPVQRTARLEGESQAPDEFDLFWEVWNLVDGNFFYDLPDAEARTQGAIEGMLGTLDDPYTGYTPPDQAALVRESDSGRFEGIGAYVETAEEGGMLIIQPFEGGPAQESGVLAGDIIVEVDGIDVRDKSMDDILSLVRGPANTEVTLTIQREGVDQLFDITVTRQRIDVPTVRSEMLEGQVGYVALLEFNQQASRRLRQAVRELLDQGAESMVLDLRNNPGGFLDQAVLVADLFLPEGDVLIQRDVSGNMREHHSNDGDPAESIPLVVLVNEGSASASEIVAGAIQDLDRGVLIGEQTFGKGSVQLQYDLSDGSILRLTYAAWFTPNDNAIDGEGIEPDILVPWQEAQDGGPDTQVEAAVEYLKAHPEDFEKASNE